MKGGHTAKTQIEHRDASIISGSREEEKLYISRLCMIHYRNCTAPDVKPSKFAFQSRRLPDAKQGTHVCLRVCVCVCVQTIFDFDETLAQSYTVGRSVGIFYSAASWGLMV